MLRHGSLNSHSRSQFQIEQVELATSEEKEKQQRLGGVVAEFLGADYYMGNADADADPATGTGAATAAPRVPLLRDFTYNFRQRDRIGIVGPNG